MKLVVTGSRGFVGGSVGRMAAAAGHEVLGIARSSQPEADWPGGYVQADVLHAPLAGIIADFQPDVVLHGAGTASVGTSFTAPLEDLRAAILTWANTLESIRLSGVRPVILFPSSAAVYGNPAALPVSEEAPVAPVSPYGFHKAACELVAREYAECFGLNIVVCRLFSVFGVRQRRLLVWELFEQLRGPEPTVHLQGTGRESRDYLCLDDLAEAMLALAANPALQGANGQPCVFNVSRGEETPILDLAHLMSRLCAAEKIVSCLGADRPGNPVRWVGDSSRLRGILPDWQPRPLADSLGRCISLWREAYL
jgi:UDP-glucose 4-epimerase